MSFIDTGRLRVISALIDKQLLPHIQTAITTAAASAGGIGEDGEETESAFSVQRSAELRRPPGTPQQCFFFCADIGIKCRSAAAS